ncbi:Flp family type IVb pilin [Sphingomonas abietis]|uniref:Flp family type IVb pilin n=1 Tax=Sphingomonas abietis TaxID=3012344 RepID=A0ABY7NIN1_9SPHN|nr:Flp family type IVb pilin [Sphingomonas abietis]WBO21183.1 Flp family type IVb pilin [Sphingomonas abietis]
MRKIRDFVRDERGGTLIEYGLILALIFVVMLVAVQSLAVHVTGTINHVKNDVLSSTDA